MIHRIPGLVGKMPVCIEFVCFVCCSSSLVFLARMYISGCWGAGLRPSIAAQLFPCSLPPLDRHTVPGKRLCTAIKVAQLDWARVMDPYTAVSQWASAFDRDMDVSLEQHLSCLDLRREDTLIADVGAGSCNLSAKLGRAAGRPVACLMVRKSSGIPGFLIFAAGNCSCCFLVTPQKTSYLE